MNTSRTFFDNFETLLKHHDDEKSNFHTIDFSTKMFLPTNIPEEQDIIEEMKNTNVYKCIHLFTTCRKWTFKDIKALVSTLDDEQDYENMIIHFAIRFCLQLADDLKLNTPLFSDYKLLNKGEQAFHRANDFTFVRLKMHMKNWNKSHPYKSDP